ncbi:acylneuraminate cytidylyltransferase family protein [Neobacillus rhizosphaerae]|uniref:acylneuraminate cytidylyltransferase family protein n=1 Tax=Neobacillus rhizosphaerae TaxID=2880965 RepID=UPI003D29B783
MIEGKKVLAVVPARGGSKGVPRKNIKELAGKPLIAWTITEAKKSSYIDKLILSSDEPEIIEVAKKYDCEVPFIRPKELANDKTPGIEPVLHAIKKMEDFDIIVLLQPTSPLRSVDDIDGCIEKCVVERANSCVSVVEVDKSPYWMFLIEEHSKMSPLMNVGEIYNLRQELPSVYVLNGAVYVANIPWLERHKTFLTSETISYIMPKNRSFDIDTEFDFLMCETIIDKEL